MIEGIDVSRWQTTTPSLAGLSFLAARATYGSFYDAMYPTHIAAAKKAGLVTIAYHFGRSASARGPNGQMETIEKQVAAFLASAGSADLFALDLERDGLISMSLSEARDFITRVKATGRKVILYHSESGFPSLGQDFDWVANWSRVPARHWNFWQYHGGPLDRDRFNGTLAQLKVLVAPPKAASWVAHIGSGTKTWFTVYHVTVDPAAKPGGIAGRVTSSRVGTTSGFTVHCKPPAIFSWTGHPNQRLVVLTSGGLYLRAKALGITVAVRAVYAREV